MVKDQNKNINFDNKIFEALNELKELLEKGHFQKLQEIINYTRNNPVMAGVSYFFIDDKIAELKNAEEKINMKQNQLKREINELKDNKRKVKNEIETKIYSIKKANEDIVYEKNNLARVGEKLTETKKELKAKEQRLLYTAKILIQQENKLQQWENNLTQKAKKIKKERKILLHDKEWNEILKESSKARTFQIGKALNDKHIWVNDIISTIDREISDSQLPEGKHHQLNKQDRNLLINNLIKDLKNKLEFFPDNINIRLANGKSICKPHPAYYTGYNNDEGTIHFQQAIYWQGTLEIILTEDITVNSSVIFSKGQILSKLKNKRIMYTREIPLPLKLVIGILNGNNEVPEFKIHSWNEKLISWRKGNFSAPLDWFNNFKSIIINNGVEGLVESDWITGDIADFINKRLGEKRTEKRLTANKPFNFLAEEFDRIIDQEWEGKASDLFKKLSSKEIIPTARKLGILLSRGARDGLPPGWNIKSIRIGDSRQQGYHITRI